LFQNDNFRHINGHNDREEKSRRFQHEEIDEQKRNFSGLGSETEDQETDGESEVGRTQTERIKSQKIEEILNSSSS